MEDEAYVDEELEPNPELNRMTNKIIGACIEVHKSLGPGHLEAHYENALEIEFRARGIPFQRQVPIQLLYRGQLVGEGRLDFLLYDQIILDLKSVERLVPLFTAMMISYLTITNHKLGLIVNFNVRYLKDGIKRVAR